MNVLIQWRDKAEPGVPGICKATEPGPWNDYREMSEKEAEQFLIELEKVKERTGFEYRIKP